MYWRPYPHELINTPVKTWIVVPYYVLLVEKSQAELTQLHAAKIFGKKFSYYNICRKKN